AQIRLIYAERTRIDRPDVRTLLSDLRANATRLGDPFVTAALHIFVSAVEGERGVLDVAERHLRVADSILMVHSNAWLRAEAEVGWTNLYCLTDDVRTAEEHATRSLHWARRSGDAINETAALGNTAHILLLKGETAGVEEKIQRALSICVRGGFLEVALLDSLLHLKLISGDLPACEHVSSRIHAIVSGSVRQFPYQYRWCQPTLARAAFRQGRVQEAQAIAAVALQAAEASQDHSLSTVLYSLLAEMAIELGDPQCGALVARARSAPLGSILDFAVAERVSAAACCQKGLSIAAAEHYMRSARAFLSIDNVKAHDDVRREATRLSSSSLTTLDHPAQIKSAVERIATGVASWCQVRRNPELLGKEARAVLESSKCVKGAALVGAGPCGVERVLESFGADVDSIRSESLDRGRGFRVCLGEAAGDRFDLWVALAGDLLADETALGLRNILQAIVHLEVASRSQRLGATLWPVESTRPDEDVADGVFASPKSRELAALARRTATTDVAVLITGDTGTGKELVARLIHRHSARVTAPFVPFNCAAVPHDMLDAQLFGHRRGAFTGATESFPGVIRAAAGGTLFLDEIGEVPLSLQPKLLRFLESGEVHPIGEPRPVSVDVRVIAATNADLEDLVARKQFREDLYYRLNVIQIAVPSLRDRREEIPLLARHFLERYTHDMGKPEVDLSEEAIACLSLRPWPGNIRELANAIRRAVALAAPGTLLTADHFQARSAPWPDLVDEATPEPEATLTIHLDQPLAAAFEQVERAIIRRALHQADGQVDAAARALGLSRKGLYLKRRRLGIEP
ncbi:MAG: sigma-54-dependent Fis family transcriptional regulator, partial [Acidobacteriota bacterium]|nr:sigma-54-dependent Fis family transcriptional regulator [Acidobacteriota bacterium]